MPLRGCTIPRTDLQTCSWYVSPEPILELRHLKRTQIGFQINIPPSGRVLVLPSQPRISRRGWQSYHQLPSAPPCPLVAPATLTRIQRRPTRAAGHLLMDPTPLRSLGHHPGTDTQHQGSLKTYLRATCCSAVQLSPNTTS